MVHKNEYNEKIVLKNMDNYILNLIFEYLYYDDLDCFKITNKSFYNDIKLFQKYKINILLESDYFSQSIKNIIINNKFGNIYISNSKILNKLSNQKHTFILGRSQENFEDIYLYKFYNSLNQKTNDNIPFNLEKIIKLDKTYINNFNTVQLLYCGGELFIIDNEDVTKYNLLTEMIKKYKINFNDNKIRSNMKCLLINNEIHIYQSFWDPYYEYEYYPLSKLVENNNNSFDRIMFNNETKLKNVRKMNAITYFDNKIWIVGGSINGINTKLVEIFDFKTGLWKEEENKLIKERLNLKLQIIDDELYAIGGDINEYLSTEQFSIEKFDKKTRTWSIVQEKINNYNQFPIITNVIKEYFGIKQFSYQSN